jgi:hypothetical protein
MPHGVYTPDTLLTTLNDLFANASYGNGNITATYDSLTNKFTFT